jgi:hypothetical protein
MTGEPGLYGLEGEPLSVVDWTLLRERLLATGELRLGFTEVSAGVTVSTIWTGIDVMAAIHPYRTPRPYETMIFGGPLDLYLSRWTSREEALEGHEALVRAARNAEEEASDD